MIPAREVADRLGLEKTRRGWRGTCPSCGYATSFALTTWRGRASGWCASCGDRDGIKAALTSLDGGDYPVREAALPSGRPSLSEAERTAQAMAVWNGAVPDHPALTEYCRARGLPGLEKSLALRWRPDARHPEVKGRHPAMVALIVDVDGAPLAAHRTYTRRDGAGKADLMPTKATKGPAGSGAIRLDDAGPELVVAEGIETAAAAGRIFSLPAWSGVSAGNIEHALRLPPEVRSVLIAADPGTPGRRAADAAAARWTREGRRVRIMTPDDPTHDFADLYAAGVRHG